MCHHSNRPMCLLTMGLLQAHCERMFNVAFKPLTAACCVNQTSLQLGMQPNTGLATAFTQKLQCFWHKEWGHTTVPIDTKLS